MRFTVKTLQGEIVYVELAVEGTTVLDLKKALSTPPREGWRSAEAIKLCCNGAVLADTDSIAAAAAYLSGGANLFLVAIVRSGKPTAPSPAANETPAPEEASDPGLAMLTEMGFDRAAATTALASSGGDIGRAVSALTRATRGGSGVSATSGSERLGRAVADRVGAPAIRQLAQAARASAIARDLAGSEQQMAMLARMPEVQRLLAMPRLEGIRERPEELQRLLRRVLVSGELQRHMKAGTVTEAMLDEILSPDAPSDGAEASTGGSSRAERFMAMAESRRQHGSSAALEAQLNATDNDAIGRLIELGGFGRRRALEAYLACDKDEAMAASLLFSQTDDDSSPDVS